MSKTRNLLMSAAIASALGVAGQAYAAGAISFNENGGGVMGSVVIDALSTTQANVLCFDCTLAGSATGATDALLLIQGQYSAATRGGTTVASFATRNFTYQLQLPVTTLNLGGDKMEIDYDSSRAALAIFRIFEETKAGSALNTTAGTGYGNLGLGESLTVASGQRIILAGTVGFDDGAGNIDPAGGVVVSETPSLITKLGPAPNGDTVNTTKISGSTTFDIDATTRDTFYFPGDVVSLSVDAIISNEALNAPFGGADTVTLNVLGRSGFTAAGLGNGFGDGSPAKQGLVCGRGIADAAVPCDIQLGTAAGTSFLNTSIVPEPGALSLMGLALAGLGVVTRRRRNAKFG